MMLASTCLWDAMLRTDACSVSTFTCDLRDWQGPGCNLTRGGLTKRFFLDQLLHECLEGLEFPL